MRYTLAKRLFCFVDFVCRDAVYNTPSVTAFFAFYEGALLNCLHKANREYLAKY